MKRFGLFLIYVFVIFLSLNAQSVTTLNDYFSTYSHKIKTNNFFVTSTSSCIYDANYMYATQSGKILTLDFGFAWNKNDNDYIHKCVLKIDLSSASFYTGFWYENFGKWEHYGKKQEITIEDKNGMDLIYTGQQSYNQGTKQDIISKIVISFGSEPLANRILNEIYAIQATYKGKEPWLLPEPEPEPKSPKTIEKTTPSPKKKNPTKGNTKPKSKSSKSGKYVQ